MSSSSEGLTVYVGYVKGKGGDLFGACVATTSLKRVSEIMSLPLAQVKKNWKKSTNEQEIEKALATPEQNIYQTI